MKFVKNDGGRHNAGFIGTASDCVARSISIITGVPYKQVHEFLAAGNAAQRVTKHSDKKKAKKKTADHGINTTRKWFKDYMFTLGFTWVPTMQVGQGCKVHLKENELPKGRLLVNVSKHFTAVIDAVLHDTHDCSREGTRCVYGYYVYNGKPIIETFSAEVMKQMIADTLPIKNKYRVNTQIVFNGYFLVEAASEGEALARVQQECYMERTNVECPNGIACDFPFTGEKLYRTIDKQE